MVPMQVERTPLNSVTHCVGFGDERVPARLWEKVDPSDTLDGCWIFTGAKIGNKREYGAAWFEDYTWTAHRLFFHLLVRPVGKADHVHHDGCPDTHCVNPAHLVCLPREEHWGHGHADKTHCPHGHEYTPENTYTSYTVRGQTGTRSPNRNCRTCRREQYQKRKTQKGR